MRKLFILVPSVDHSGPVKGAFALARMLAATDDVTFVSLKSGFSKAPAFVGGLRCVSLEQEGCFLRRVFAYRRLLKAAGRRPDVASLSFCFSADMTNLLCRDRARTVASVRGNLPMNYRMDYGLAGLVLARLHMVLLRGFDAVTVMTRAMAEQIAPFCKAEPALIGNFVDELALEPYRSVRKAEGPYRFVFLASLSERKQPLVLLRAMAKILAQGETAHLDIIGCGPQESLCQSEASALGLERVVTFHGHLADPYALLASAEALVLPSLSEGVARSSLEALYLGVPVVLRAVDGNPDLVREGVNGALFAEDEALPAAMIKAARLARTLGAPAPSLLPQENRQEQAARQYRKLMNNDSA